MTCSEGCAAAVAGGELSMAMVLAPVAVGAALVAAWWRWGAKAQDSEEGGESTVPCI